VKRIAILLPDLRGGGAERVAVNLANSFVMRGHDVDIVLLAAKGEFLSDLRSEIRIIDLKVNRIRWVLLPLIRYLRQVRPEAVLINMWPLTVIALWARMLACISTRMIVVEHTTWSKDAITNSVCGRWRVRSTMHLFFPWADGIVAVSQGAGDDLAWFANIDRNCISVIYNPVVGFESSNVSLQMAPADWWLGVHQRILAVGSLSPIKNYAFLLLAFAHLRVKVNARLLILGEGICRTELEAQVKSLGIETSVFMPGFVKDPMPYYQHADLHVLSSKGEGFGNVIVEALAAGTPVVSTDCKSGPREILSDGQFGRLVPVDDVLKFALAMTESLNSTHDYPILKARALDFSIDKAVEQYEKLLLPCRAL
jgi:glycosyltransferase involved in cell wall biosynthesis